MGWLAVASLWDLQQGGLVLRRDAQGPQLPLQLPAPPFSSQRGDRALGGEPTYGCPSRPFAFLSTPHSAPCGGKAESLLLSAASHAGPLSPTPA